VLIGPKSMGGETTAAWRAFLRDLGARGLREPDVPGVDAARGPEAALAELWRDAPLQRCTVHTHRNLLAHAPTWLHDALSEEYRDMV
jgi:transposase-like protein